MVGKKGFLALHDLLPYTTSLICCGFEVLAVVGGTVMSRATFFVQECPTCGRRLQVRVVHLGKTLECQHCRGTFEASDADNEPQLLHDSGIDLIIRADELLATADQMKNRPR